jgi:hypothetical protein
MKQFRVFIRGPIVVVELPVEENGISEGFVVSLGKVEMSAVTNDTKQDLDAANGVF